MPSPLVDTTERTVSSRIFTDPDIFRAEQATIFSRTWLYLGHRSQLTKPGDFIQTYAGTIPLLLCMDQDGELNAIANVCAHRGSRICQLEQGNADHFVCPYHNWVFDNRGNLTGIPRRVPPDFDKARWSLVHAAKLETYRDLIFATFSPEAPPLADYLGEMVWYLDLLLNLGGAGMEVSAGTHRSVAHCNWKLPAEQFGSDNWHFQGVHGSMAKLGRRNEDPNHEDSFHAWMNGGHMLICVAPKTELPSAYASYLNDLLSTQQISPLQRRLLRCTIVITVFPNLSIVYFPGLCSIRVWHPRSPGTTEIWSWALYHRDAPQHVKTLMRRQVTQMFSPTGMLEQDDLEVWARLDANLSSMPPHFRLCYAFGGKDEGAARRSFPGTTASLQSDLPAFAFYQRWAELLGSGAGFDAQ